METTSQLILVEKSKKSTELRSFLDCKKIDKNKIKEYFLENFSNIPQELRLILWKIVLGISSPFYEQNNSLDKQLEEHFLYLKHIIKNVLEINYKNQENLNFCIYLLERDNLPINYEEALNIETSFTLIYKQLNEILDDQSDFESYYLTVEIYENLKINLKNMKEKFDNCLSNETFNRQLIEQLDIMPFLECGLAGFFRDLKMYHIIWDRLAMGEYEMLICVLLSFFESCKEDQLKLLKVIKHSEFYQINSKFGLDECKILKRTAKYYRALNTKSSMSDLIVKYFNIK